MAKRIIKTVDGKIHYDSYVFLADYIEYAGFLTKKKLYKRMIVEDPVNANFVNILATLIIVLGIAIGIGFSVIEDHSSIKTSISTFIKKL